MVTKGSAGMTIRILLVDDHKMFRQALCNLLQAEADLEVVGQTGDGLQVLKLASATAPDVVCMDINMPGLSGIAVTRDLLSIFPKIKVLALSSYFQKRYVLDMLDAGASGYVTKTEASDVLLWAIRVLQQGRRYLCPEVAQLVPGGTGNREQVADPPELLGRREHEVLKLVAEGLTSIQIGEQMHIATSTVEVHRRNIMRKLKLHSVAELTRYVLSRQQQ
jgi:two-component system NarL family response regulator